MRRYGLLPIWIAALVAGAATSGCATLPGGATGLDPKFLEGVKDVITDPKCGHDDKFNATVGAAGIPASTTVSAERHCPAPLATSVTQEGMQEAINKAVDAAMEARGLIPAPPH